MVRAIRGADQARLRRSRTNPPSAPDSSAPPAGSGRRSAEGIAGGRAVAEPEMLRETVLRMPDARDTRAPVQDAILLRLAFPWGGTCFPAVSP